MECPERPDAEWQVAGVGPCAPGHAGTATSKCLNAQSMHDGKRRAGREAGRHSGMLRPTVLPFRAGSTDPALPASFHRTGRQSASWNLRSGCGSHIG
jgi:hypothetical protein